MRHLGPSFWSKLDADVRDSLSLSSFENKIRNTDLECAMNNDGNCCELCSSLKYTFFN